MLRLPRGSL